MLLYTLLGNISSNAATVLFLLFCFLYSCCDLSPEIEVMKKEITEIEIEIETEGEKDVWVFGKHQQIHSPCEAFKMWQFWQVETSGEMLPITLQEMKYGLSRTIHEGHRWPDVCAWTNQLYYYRQYCILNKQFLYIRAVKFSILRLSKLINHTASVGRAVMSTSNTSSVTSTGAEQLELRVYVISIFCPVFGSITMYSTCSVFCFLLAIMVSRGFILLTAHTGFDFVFEWYVSESTEWICYCILTFMPPSGCNNWNCNFPNTLWLYNIMNEIPSVSVVLWVSCQWANVNAKTNYNYNVLRRNITW